MTPKRRGFGFLSLRTPVSLDGFDRRGAQMMTLIHRDVEAVPAAVVAGRRSREQEWLHALLRPLPGHRRKLVRAAVAHATSFTTWQSLCGGQGLSDRSAVELVVGMVERAAQR